MPGERLLTAILETADLDDPTDRAILSDALEEVGRDREAELLRSSAFPLVFLEETGEIDEAYGPEELDPLPSWNGLTECLGYFPGWFVRWYANAEGKADFDLEREEDFFPDVWPRRAGRNEVEEAVRLWLEDRYAMLAGAGPVPGDLLRIEHRLVWIAGLQEEENA